MAAEILPPFDDELIEARDKERAIVFLQELELPSRIAASLLVRFGRATGLAVSTSDLLRVGRGRSRPV